MGELNHNDSLRSRFLAFGLNTFEDVEVIELLLGLTVDNRTHRQDAETLVRQYSGLSGIINTAQTGFSNNRIKEEHLFGLRLPYESANRYLYDGLRQRPLMNCAQAVVDYLSHSMRGLKVEHFRVLYLDATNQLIDEEDLSKGTVGQAMVYPREVIKSALEHHASGLIIAHNHPSGNRRPSADDTRITERLSGAASLFDIEVHDHIIVAGESYYSFADAGLLNNKNQTS